MADVDTFGGIVLACALVALGAVWSSRISAWLRVPAPVIFLICAAAASDLLPNLGGLSTEVVQRLVTVALAIILFDGGMHIGWRRFRSAAPAVLWIGVVGTFLTAAALAGLAHWLFGFTWWLALLLGTALAPTDPAVVFSVLAGREIAGPSGVILEGESAANDPVGIALLVSLLAAGTSGGTGAVAGVAETFAVQMLVGAVIGVVGGWLLLAIMRRVRLPREGLYALQTLATALGIYGAAALAHGSGFLAVFLAGVIVGDAHAPYKGDIRRFHASLAGIAEIAVFVVLGLTMPLRTLLAGNVWLIGLILAVVLTFLVRPLVVGSLLLPIRMRWGERVFVAWAGLKGAVPILLGTYIVGSGITGAARIYGVIFVVVAFSILVQGGLIPTIAARGRVPMRAVEPLPWALGVRFRTPPQGVRRLRVARGAPADGTAIDELGLDEGAWVSLVIRHGEPLHVRGSTVLAAGDEIVLLIDPEETTDLEPIFSTPAPS